LSENYLIVLLGPTGVGKTNLSLALANRLKAPILSSDSRQFYREMNIGTAKPSNQELSQATHYFIGHKSVTERYSCGMFELDALQKLHEIFAEQRFALLVGGSMLYIDAVCKGIDDFPAPDPKLRSQLQELLKREGLESLRARLRLLDPDYYQNVDLMNLQRVLKGVEVSLQTGRPYSTFLSKQAKERDFNIIYIGLNRPREELYQRINSRVDSMVTNGLVEEARILEPYKHTVALKTVGYTEIFDYFEVKHTLNEAIELIKRNSRRYAKRQLTWWQREPRIQWFHPDKYSEIEAYLTNRTI